MKDTNYMNTKVKLESWDANLVNWIKAEKPTIWTKLVHCSRSGMYRAIDVFVIKNNEPLRLNYIIEQYGIAKQDKRHQYALGVTGCGMDMGFDLVYNLSIALFCPDKYDHDSAYTLKQRWL